MISLIDFSLFGVVHLGESEKRENLWFLHERTLILQLILSEEGKAGSVTVDFFRNMTKLPIRTSYAVR